MSELRKADQGFKPWADIASDWSDRPGRSRYAGRFENKMAKRIASKAENLFSALGFGHAGDLHDDIDMFLVSRKKVYGDWPKAEREIIFHNIDLVRAEIADRGMKATGRG